MREAKRRGLTCGVGSSSSSNNQNTSNNDNSIDNRNVWSDERICQMATLDIEGIIRWRDKNDNIW